MARQAYLFSDAASRALQIRVDSLLRTMVGKPHFSRIINPINTLAVAFSVDGSRLASIHFSPDEVLLWDLTQPGAQPTVLPGYPGDPDLHPHALVFSPDGKQLIEASPDGSIMQWDPEHPQTPLQDWPTLKAGVWSAAFSGGGWPVSFHLPERSQPSRPCGVAVAGPRRPEWYLVCRFQPRR